MTILSAFVLAVVISIDTLATGFVYGTSKIKVPLKHVLVIDAIGSILLSAGLFFGFLLSNIIHPEITNILSIGILVAMGCYKILTYLIKKIKKTANAPCNIKWTETIVLAIALSFDNIAVGIGAAIHNASVVFCIAVLISSIVTDFFFFVFGYSFGKKVIEKTSLDLSGLSGAVLVLIGVLKLWV